MNHYRSRRHGQHVHVTFSGQYEAARNSVDSTIQLLLIVNINSLSFYEISFYWEKYAVATSSSLRSIS